VADITSKYPELTKDQKFIFDYLMKTTPEFLNQSEDFQVFLLLMSLVFGDTRTKLNDWWKLVDIDECPEEFLPLLAGLIGYEWDYRLSGDEQRLLIKNFLHTYRRRGTIQSIVNVVRLVGQTQTSFYTNANLAEVYVKEYGIHSDPLLEADPQWGPGVILVSIPENAYIVRDYLPLVVPAGVKVLFEQRYTIPLTRVMIEVSPQLDVSYEMYLPLSRYTFKDIKDYVFQDIASKEFESFFWIYTLSHEDYQVFYEPPLLLVKPTPLSVVGSIERDILVVGLPQQPPAAVIESVDKTSALYETFRLDSVVTFIDDIEDKTVEEMDLDYEQEELQVFLDLQSAVIPIASEAEILPQHESTLAGQTANPQPTETEIQSTFATLETFRLDSYVTTFGDIKDLDFASLNFDYEKEYQEVYHEPIIDSTATADTDFYCESTVMLQALPQESCETLTETPTSSGYSMFTLSSLICTFGDVKDSPLEVLNALDPGFEIITMP